MLVLMVEVMAVHGSRMQPEEKNSRHTAMKPPTGCDDSGSDEIMKIVSQRAVNLTVDLFPRASFVK